MLAEVKDISNIRLTETEDAQQRVSIHRCQPSRNDAGNPAIWLISRIPAFLRERPAFLAYFEISKIAENGTNLSCTETVCSKSSAKTSMIASPSY